MRGVLSGKIPACQATCKVVERHMRDLKTAGKRGYYFDEDAAELVIDFFRLAAALEGRVGRPAVCARAMAAIHRLGAIRLEAQVGRHAALPHGIRVRAAKNGKTTTMAGLGLYLTVGDGEPGADVFSAATKRDQAKLSWSEAVKMRNASPALKELVQYWKSSDTLDMESTNSKFQPLGADADTMDGLNVHGALIDELHAHKTPEVVDVLQTATGSRRQPLQFEITTAGTDIEGIGHEHYDYCKKILDQVFDDDTWFTFIAELDEGDDWQDEHTWAKANPNLGISVKLDDLRRKANEAKNRPAALNNFLCKHLNKWVQQVERWIAIEKWDACRADGDLSELVGRECYGGLDLSSKIDISAFALIFPLGDGVFRQLSWYWIPEESLLEREHHDRVPYSVWRDAGWVRGDARQCHRLRADQGQDWRVGNVLRHTRGRF